MIGTPYSKLDCWGIVKEFYKLVFGIELKRYYDEIPNDMHKAKNLIYTNIGDFEIADSPRMGDIILIKLMGVESHIAVYLGDGKLLHTTEKTGCCIDSVKKYERLIVNYYRVVQ